MVLGTYQSYLVFWYPPFEKESAQTEGGYQNTKTDHPKKNSRAFGAQSKSPLFLLSDPTLFKSAQTEGGTNSQGGTNSLNSTDTPIRTRAIAGSFRLMSSAVRGGRNSFLVRGSTSKLLFQLFSKTQNPAFCIEFHK